MKHVILAGFFVMALFPGAGTLNAAQSSSNLITNSSFERLTEEGIPVEWVAGGNTSAISLDRAKAHDGKASLHFVLDGKAASFTQKDYFRLEPGRYCTFSAYVKTKNLDPTSNFQLMLINVGWSFGYQSRLSIENTGSKWKRYTKTFVVPAADAHQYQGRANVDYKVMMYAQNARGEIWVDAVQLEYGKRVTKYVPKEGKSVQVGDQIAEARFNDAKRAGFEKAKHFQIKNPLFGELLSNKPGPKRLLYYGYEDLYPDEVYRPFAKTFGHRYVLAEQVKALRSRPLIPMTNAWKRGGVGSYPTMRMILRPDIQGVAPKMIGDWPWIMHPGWQKAYLESAVKLARQSLDKSQGNTWGNTWGLWAGDEVFESFGIKVVPVDKRDAAVRAIDAEIKEQFGFGRHGMPDSPEDKNPFRRIAFRRWVNAKLTELFKQTYEAVKKINPKLVMFGPDPCGGVPPVDLEAMTPYFDLVSGQAWQGRTSFVDLLTVGADTKALVDLSVCPVWTLVQHAGIDDPESLREQYSQVFRNGGQGLVLLGLEWYDRELDHPQFANSAKWRALLEISDTAMTMNKVKLPDPDTAVLYASDTYLTWDDVKMANPKRPQVYAAYAALGPGAGSWFSFVSDRQIDRDLKDLKDYKILYIPLATYQRGAVLEKVEQYVRDGGILVCTDPSAFTWDINGDDLSPKWEKLTGVKRGKAREGTVSAKTVKRELLKECKEISLNFPGPGIRIMPTDKATQPLVVFADGSPAAIIRACGKGQVIFFASDPFASGDRNTPLTELVKHIQLAAGARINQDIWRFKLPPFKTVQIEEKEEYRCLTNNHVELNFGLVQHEPASAHNLATSGTYTYDRFPTGIADAAKTGNISFDQGHLTNRKQAYAGRNLGGARNPVELGKWIVSWTDKEPVKLTIDLKKAYILDRMRLFYSGILPAVTVEGSADGQTWELLGEYPAQPATVDVIDIIVSLKGNYRYVRVGLAARAGDAAMELAEIEVWGKMKIVSGPDIRFIVRASDEYPRHSEASVVELSDGTLLMVWTEFMGKDGKGGDNTPARLAAMTSRDGGASWAQRRILVENEPGDINVFSPNLLFLPDGELLFVFFRYHVLDDNVIPSASCYVCRSRDEGKTFSPPRPLWTRKPWVHPSGVLRQLSSGRLLLPMSQQVGRVWSPSDHIVSGCMVSDDGGETWQEPSCWVDLPLRGAMEPHVVELRDGRVLMIMRTQLGAVFKSVSSDGGVTWSKPQTTGLKSPESCPEIIRLPNTGNLLLVWNNADYDPASGSGHFGRRTPLTVAVSKNDGETWEHIKDIETDPGCAYSNPGCSITGAGKVILTYWAAEYTPDGRFSSQLDLKAALFDVNWLYQPVEKDARPCTFQ